MSDLPPGFVRDKKPAALPPGFVRDKKPAAQGELDESQGPAAPGWLRGLMTGVIDPIYGDIQLAEKIIPSPPGLKSLPSIDKPIQEREQRYEAGRQERGQTGADWPRWLGNLISPANLGVGKAIGAASEALGVGTGLMSRLGTAAAGGAAGGATMPVTEKGDFWAEKEKQAGMGAAGGAVMGGAGAALGRAIAPKAAAGDPATMMQGGVRLTPGSMNPGMGNWRKTLEDKWQSWPILGDFIRNAKIRSLDSFITATINQALEPIGASLPKKTQAGTEAVRVAGNALSKAYDDALGRVPSVMADPELTTALKAIETQARRNPDVWRKLEPAIKHDIYDEFANSGRLEGRDVKTMVSEQSRLARRYKKGPDADNIELGERYEQVRDALKDAVKRQYPAEATNIQNADNGWAMLTRIEQAAANRSASRGRFTPADLLTASKSQAGGVRKREFARGDALFQDWASAAQNVLPSSYPDSGTAGRLLGAHPLSALAQGGLYTGAYAPLMGGLPRSYGAPGAARGALGNAARRGGVTAAPGAGGAAADAGKDKRKRDLRPSAVGG